MEVYNFYKFSVTDEVDMCKAIQEMYDDGVRDGIKQGIQKGVEQGREELLKELIQSKLQRKKLLSRLRKS